MSPAPTRTAASSVAGVPAAECAWPLESVISATADHINPKHNNSFFMTSLAPAGWPWASIILSGLTQTRHEFSLKFYSATWHVQPPGLTEQSLVPRLNVRGPKFQDKRS